MGEIDNYYTPLIDEFHIGFEYERLQPIIVEKLGCKVYIKGWVEEEMTQHDFEHKGWDRRKDIEDDFIRVKYLDHEDLIELGFKHIGGKLVKDLLQDYTWYNSRFYVHIKYSKLSDHAVLKVEVSVEETSVRTLVIHSIGIRNKSELIKLMYQLNVM
jgi:hypothetical protein